MYRPLLVILLATLASAQSLQEFRAWAKANARTYTPAEEARRFAIFRQNAAIAASLTASSPGAVFGATRFSDLTQAEFAAMYTSRNTKKVAEAVNINVPDSTDSAVNNSEYLPPIRDQGKCTGGGYAFAAVACAEGYANKREQGKNYTFSDQQVIACSTANDGCEGGDVGMAMLYLTQKGAAYQEDFPWDAANPDGVMCHLYEHMFNDFGGEIMMGHLQDEQLIKDVNDYGFLAASVDGASSAFQHYVSGVISEGCKSESGPNHYVTLVGYGTDEKAGKYWLIRNSWGIGWGEDGYARISRGKNVCGINSDLSAFHDYY